MDSNSVVDNIQEVSKLAKAFKVEYPNLSDYEALRLAIELHKHEALENTWMGHAEHLESISESLHDFVKMYHKSNDV